MKRKILLIGLLSLGLLSTVVSCKQGSEGETKTVYGDTSSEDNLHTDSDYKYEYRTGTSGNYEYNYDVVGQDESGNDIEGNVEMQGRYGSGTVIDADGIEKDVELEWVGYGELEATDDDGNTYTMETE